MNTNDAVAVREAVERRILNIWDDSSAEWCDAVGGPAVHEIFAERLLSAVFDEIAATDSAATVAKDGGAFGMQVTNLVSEIRAATSLAWRDSLIENLLELIEPSAYATPKPEASAATQQAGEVGRSDFEKWARTCDGNCNDRDLLKWDPKHKHAPEGVTYHSALVERDWTVWQAARRLAAPISEDMGKGFPERDHTKPAEQQGMFRKFDVRRTDGSSAPGGKHHGCRYWVLDLDHDQHAPAAMRAYAAEVRDTHPQLAADIDKQFPAAPVSDGDAMPPMPKAERELIELHQPTTYTTHVCTSARYTADQMRAYVLADRADRLARGVDTLADAARTVTGSGGSIGDDASIDSPHFRALVDSYVRFFSTDEPGEKGEQYWRAIVAYIDARTARNAGVAAPDTSARDAVSLLAEVMQADISMQYMLGSELYERATAFLAKSKGQS